MKPFLKTLLVVILCVISGVALAKNLVLVEENHAEIESDGVTYVLDSYIVMFEQPYYILVQRKDNQAVNPDVAEDVAIEYILPRGCTVPLERRPDLDRRNEDGTKLIIGVAC